MALTRDPLAIPRAQDLGVPDQVADGLRGGDDVGQVCGSFRHLALEVEVVVENHVRNRRQAVCSRERLKQLDGAHSLLQYRKYEGLRLRKPHEIE